MEQMNLKNELSGAKQVAITGHIRPDGDCIGSCLALSCYIKRNYPDIAVDVYLESVPEKYLYLAGAADVKTQVCRDGEQEYDVLFVLDCGDIERIGFSASVFNRARKTVNIDHHISNDKSMCQVSLVRPEAAATCEVLYDLMTEDVDLDTATALYTGLIHDTGVFKHSNTTEHTMTAAARLVGLGVPFTRIINESFYQKSYVQNQILGRALLESIVFFHGTCIFSALRQKDLEFYGVTSADLDGIVDQLISTKGILCAIFLYETEPHVFKVSLRSRENIDVSRIACHFGGGGHVKAAGCSMVGSVHDVINNLSQEIERQMV